MAVNFANKSKQNKIKKAGTNVHNKNAPPSWAKSGAAGAEKLKQADAKAKAQQAEYGKLRRFFLKKGEEKNITFLDGDLDAEGFPRVPLFDEHQLYLNGSWGNHFVCCAETEECPVCEGGAKPYFVAVYTIIDHSEYEYNGVVYKNQKKLFAAKRGSYKQLMKIAKKRGGLAGCTFEVARVGDKAPAVGDMFEFLEKNPLAEIQDQFKTKDDDMSPLVLEKEITYRTAAELKALGFGTTGVGSGASTSSTAGVENEMG